MEPEEIMSRAERVGVLILRVDVRIVEPLDVRGYVTRPYPIRKTFRYCERFVDGFSVKDGMCRHGRDDWLPWENHGKTWCFLDDDVYDMREEKLKEALYAEDR